MNRNISVHLQDFPDISFLKEDNDLVSDIDLVRQICSTALSIRDQMCLRVRLPLNSITIIGPDSKKMIKYQDLILDEINVKEFHTQDSVTEFADFKPEIDPKILGPKFGKKFSQILTSIKSGEWKLNGKFLEVSDIKLDHDEFKMNLSLKENTSKNDKFKFASVNNSLLIKLDIEITEHLKQEGVARDFIRIIQQARKSINLDVSDKINLNLFSKDTDIKNSIEAFLEYIKEQTLSSSIKILEDDLIIRSKESKFEDKIEDSSIIFSIEKI